MTKPSPSQFAQRPLATLKENRPASYRRRFAQLRRSKELAHVIEQAGVGREV